MLAALTPMATIAGGRQAGSTILDGIL